MRHILKSVLREAFKIVSVAVEVVAGISQPALTRCQLENGATAEFHAGHTGFAPPQVGDYAVVSGAGYQHVPKAIFEAMYLPEYDAELYHDREERLAKLGGDATASGLDGESGE
jgi:hypothetical protein